VSEATRAEYRTSSFSQMDNCVEVLLEPHGPVRVRDTKDRSRPAVSFPTGPWQAFVGAIRAGEFGRPTV
jgi:hypothetical protein